MLLFCCVPHAQQIESDLAAGRCCTFHVDLAVHLLPGHPGSLGQRLQVVPGLEVDDAVQVVLRWRAQNACAGRRMEGRNRSTLTSQSDQQRVRLYVSCALLHNAVSSSEV